MAKSSVLIVDDQPEILNSLERLLKEKYMVYRASGGDEALNILKKHEVAVILADQRMPGMTGVVFLSRSIDLQPQAIKILVTAYADIDASIAAVNEGQIFYYLSKPWENDELLLIVQRAEEQYNLQKENRQLTRDLEEANARLEKENIWLKQNAEQQYDFSRIIGHGPAMQKVFKLTSKIIGTSTTVLLLGETGTGKELLAKAIHYNGPRKSKLFVTQNCGALSDSLLESELFGHVRGAFTGAVSDKKGIFQMANAGTVFLDEIADTSAAMQTRLLRVLQEGEIRPVGGTKPVQVDVRVIAATNKDLEEEVQAGRFREDLYYRLNVFPIMLPPLRQRQEDIPELVSHFIQQFSKKIGKKIKSADNEVVNAFSLAPFPGNIRELENEMERAVTLAEDGSEIQMAHLSQRFRESSVQDASNPCEALKDQVEALEKRLIRNALKETNLNIAQAAKKLGLSRAGLYKKLDRYDINPDKV